MATNKVYEIMTEQMLKLIDEKGLAPWQAPWNPAVGMPLSLSTGKPYRGLNVMMLGMQSQIKGYESPWWGTYNQITERGGQVRKGEKSTVVVFWSRVKGKEKNDDGTNKSFFMLRYFRVFNADQVDDLEGKTFKVPAVPDINLDAATPIEAAEKIVTDYFAREKVTLTCGDMHAYYVPSLDSIHVPSREAFQDAEAYYAVLFHEMGHSTGHATRLKREGVEKVDQFGSERYSFEELIAEFTSVFMSGMSGIEHMTIERSPSYLANWRTKLGSEPTWLVKAAAAAQKAADYILGVSYTKEASEPENEKQAA